MLSHQESFTREMGKTCSSPSSLLSSALLWEMVSTGASHVVQAAVAQPVTWCCLPLWHWPAALMAPSMWGTSTSSAGCILMDILEPYWNSSESHELFVYSWHKTSLILVGITHSGKQQDFEHRIDLSTITTKLAWMIWVSMALALVGISSCDLFDLTRIYFEVCLHAKAECVRFRHHRL